MKRVWSAVFAISLGICGCSTTPPQSTVQSEVALAIAKKNNCLACHGVDKRLVGPSFKDVSARYRGQDVQQQLFRKVKNGGAGVWGVIPEPPNMQISDENLKLLIRWITEMEPSPGYESRKANSASASPAKCSVTVTQAGKEVVSKADGRIQIYEMQSAPFSIEVSSGQCKPSVGTFPNVGDFKYVADNPIVLSGPTFSMAGSDETRDVLHFRSENPRLIEGYEDVYNSYKKEYEVLCRAQGKCPLKIRAYRTYWNFVADNNNAERTYADFKRLTLEKPLPGIRGDMPVIVYTKYRDFLDAQGHAYLQAMETHPIVLKFR